MKVLEKLKIVTHEPETPPGRRARRRGEIIHQALALCETAKDLEGAVRGALELLGESPKDWDLQELLDPLRRLFAVERFGEWLRKEGYPELEVVDSSGRVHRIDRVVLDGDTLHVLEYKVGERERGHEEQVRLYAELLKELFPTKRIKGWLIYVDQALIVEVL